MVLDDTLENVRQLVAKLIKMCCCKLDHRQLHPHQLCREMTRRSMDKEVKNALCTVRLFLCLKDNLDECSD